MDHFTPVDTMNGSNFLRSVIQPDLTNSVHFLMPVTGFEYNGQPVTPPGFDKEYGLFLTIDGTAINNPGGTVDHFTSLNVTLWADPKNDAGTPSVSETSDPAFSNGIANDIVLAIGTMVSGSMSVDPTTNIRHADLVESLTPTLAGTVLLDGSIKPGSLLEEQTTTLPTEGGIFPQPDGGLITTISGGTVQITLDPQDTILVPNITHAHLQLADVPRFIHGSHDGHHGGDRQVRQV
jgi:hypothetical protein